MDVNGFGYLIKKAQEDECQLKFPRWDVESLSLESLQTAFSQHQSWSELNNEDSHFVKFLRATCSHATEEGKFCPQKLRCIGFLWSDDDKKEKVVELYDILQDEGSANTKEITCNDRDLKKSILFMFELATKIVHEQEAIFNEQDPPELEDNSERAKEILEELIDEVFGTDSRLPRKEFMNEIMKKQSFLFTPQGIRNKF